MRAEAMASGELNRLEPELTCVVLAFNVNVRRFIAIETREKEPVWTGDAFDTRHTARCAPYAIASNDAAMRRMS
jgi:hypothetical protein